jgi:hypothetical protein
MSAVKGRKILVSDGTTGFMFRNFIMDLWRKCWIGSQKIKKGVKKYHMISDMVTIERVFFEI